MKQLFCSLMVLSLFLGIAGQGKGQPTYGFTTLDVPGSSYTSAYGINALGQIVGEYGDAGGNNSHGFLLDQGSYTTLDVPGSAYTEPYGINDSGQVVGTYDDAGGGRHGFLLDQGSYTTLDVPGWPVTYAQGINASGQIVGVLLQRSAQAADEAWWRPAADRTGRIVHGSRSPEGLAGA